MKNNRVRCIRKCLGYHDNQIKAFADRFGVLEDDVLKYENQEAVPGLRFASEISKELELPLEFVYGYNMKPSKGYSEDIAKENLDGDWEDAERKGILDYVKFNACKCVFTRKFYISKNLNVIQSKEDYDYACLIGELSKDDNAYLSYFKSKGV